MSTELQRAMSVIGAGAKISTSPCCSTPTMLLRGLGARAREVPGLQLSTGLLLGELDFVDAIRDGSLAMRSWQVSGALRPLASSGIVQYVPLRASSVAHYLQGQTDIALIRVSPPDAEGWCSLGPSASYTAALVAAAGLVIAEVDPGMPRPLGEHSRIRRTDIDHLIESDTPIATYPEAARSDVTDSIVSTVVGLIPDGASVQLGIGAVPQGVASGLSTSELSDLRMIGLACDSMVALLDSGRLAKGVGIHAAEVLGTQAIFSAVDRNPAIRLSPSSVMHDPLWLATQPRLISVCSALAVDLTGQVASESVNGKILAGAGGSADFFDGARLSPGGRCVIAMPATTASGDSRITAQFGAGTAVTWRATLSTWW